LIFVDDNNNHVNNIISNIININDYNNNINYYNNNNYNPNFFYTADNIDLIDYVEENINGNNRKDENISGKILVFYPFNYPFNHLNLPYHEKKKSQFQILLTINEKQLSDLKQHFNSESKIFENEIKNLEIKIQKEKLILQTMNINDECEENGVYEFNEEFLTQELVNDIRDEIILNDELKNEEFNKEKIEKDDEIISKNDVDIKEIKKKLHELVEELKEKNYTINYEFLLKEIMKIVLLIEHPKNLIKKIKFQNEILEKYCKTLFQVNSGEIFGTENFPNYFFENYNKKIKRIMKPNKEDSDADYDSEKNNKKIKRIKKPKEDIYFYYDD
jgi:hypothetical protein